MKVLSVVGARPQFVKLGPVASQLRLESDITHVVVHTGQHYDPMMSDVFIEALGIPTPDVNLRVGSSSHAIQTGAILAGLEVVLQDQRPDWTIVYGDTNSTLGAALAAVKMQFRVAHVEAGLRSYNRRMPEEHNRVLTDHAADLLLAPTEIARTNLNKEGLLDRTVVVGDVMADLCFLTRDAVRRGSVALPKDLETKVPYLIATIHRAANTDDSQRLAAIVSALREMSAPVFLLAHPRLVARASQFGIDLAGGMLRMMLPLAHAELVHAIMGAAGVVTDSGGLQKEAFLLGVPCTTLRTETEWVETLVDGWNVLDPDLVFVREVGVRAKPVAVHSAPYGDGGAARRIVTALREFG